jgi:hypothetical protein
MSIAYPPVLPAPLSSGYAMGIGQTDVRTEMDAGPARQRRRHQQKPVQLQLSWLMTRDQLSVFEYFYEVVLDGGAEWFDGPLSSGVGCTASVPLRLISGYEVTQAASDGLWQITANAELRALPERRAEYLLLDGTAGTFAQTPSTNALAPQRENLLARSEELDAAVWQKNFVTVTANQATDSLGNLTLDKLEVAAGNDGNPWIRQSPFGAPLRDVQLTAGLELKAGNISRAIVQFFVDGGGAVTHTAASIISGPGTISGVGTGAVTITGLSTTEVTKISLTGTPSFSSGNLYLYIKPQNTTVNVGDFIHVGRVQMNRGATLHQYPQTLANRVTEDLEIEVDIAADDYTPEGFATLTSQRNDGAAETTAHQLRILTDGRVQLLLVNPDAPSIYITDNISTVPIGAVDGSRIKVRASLDVDNGAGGHDVKFFVNDVQLGATVTTAGITCFQSPLSTPLRVGAIGAGESFKGKIYRAEVRYGIGAAPRAVFDASDGKHLATSFVSSETGETWTMKGNAQLVKPSLVGV